VIHNVLVETLHGVNIKWKFPIYFVFEDETTAHLDSATGVRAFEFRDPGQISIGILKA
jgi:hypothetical protein